MKYLTRPGIKIFLILSILISAFIVTGCQTTSDQKQNPRVIEEFIGESKPK